jgi:hypothetical protein
VGGIESGTTFPVGTRIDYIITQLLSKYQLPKITTANLGYISTPISNTYEVGDTITFNRLLITSSLENPGTVYPQNIILTTSGLTTDIVTSIGNISSAQSNINLGIVYTRTRNTVGDVTVSITGENTSNISITPYTIVYSFNYVNTLAASDIIIIDDTTAENVFLNNSVDRSVVGNTSWDAICTADNNNPINYTYIIYPNTYSDISYISQDEAQPVLGAFTKVLNSLTANYTFSITNANGIVGNYKIYKSNVPGAFANGVKLTIS